MVIHTPVLHTDNDSVFCSKECTDCLLAARVHLHYAAAYEPRTNPYSESSLRLIVAQILLSHVDWGCFKLCEPEHVSSLRLIVAQILLSHVDWGCFKFNSSM